MNKKAVSIGPVMFYLIELILVALIIFSGSQTIKDKAERQDIIKAEYAIHYSYCTTLLASSPDAVVIISDERKPYVLNHRTEYTNFATISSLGSDKQTVFPFALPLIGKDFSRSYVDDFIYFIKDKDVITVSNIKDGTKSYVEDSEE